MSLKCGDIIDVVKKLAPENLQEKWDNSGLNVGDRETSVKKILFALDAVDSVIDEAIENDVDMIITHHPMLLFVDLKNITTDSEVGRRIYKLIRNNISLYCAHTSLDVAYGGTNDVLSNLIELSDIEILQETKAEKVFKVATYVPFDSVDNVRKAMGDSGCGHIGNYSHCTFSSEGKGQFKPLEGTNPYIGETGVIETVNEIKIETVVNEKNLSKVIKVINDSHPYEEPAIDIIPMEIKGEKQGIGRIGNIKPEMTFIEFSKFVKNKLGLDSMRITGDENKIVKRCALCTGAGTDFFNIAKSKGADVYITGDVKFHEAQKALSMGLCLIDGTHYATENIAVPVMAEYVKNAVENKGEKVEIIISKFNGQTFKNI